MVGIANDNLSPRGAPEFRLVSVTLVLAAAYNILWGAIAALAPVKMLQFLGIEPAAVTTELWQCIGMFVALYGVCYWMASRDPVRYGPFVLIGLVGKVLGPAGALVAIASNRLPRTFLWTNVTNDFVWWIPFVWVLWVIRRWDKSRD